MADGRIKRKTAKKEEDPLRSDVPEDTMMSTPAGRVGQDAKTSQMLDAVSAKTLQFQMPPPQFQMPMPPQFQVQQPALATGFQQGQYSPYRDGYGPYQMPSQMQPAPRRDEPDPNSNLRRFGVSRSHEDAKKKQRSLFRVDYV